MPWLRISCTQNILQGERDSSWSDRLSNSDWNHKHTFYNWQGHADMRHEMNSEVIECCGVHRTSKCKHLPNRAYSCVSTTARWDRCKLFHPRTMNNEKQLLSAVKDMHSEYQKLCAVKNMRWEQKQNKNLKNVSCRCQGHAVAEKTNKLPETSSRCQGHAHASADELNGFKRCWGMWHHVPSKAHIQEEKTHIQEEDQLAEAA